MKTFWAFVLLLPALASAQRTTGVWDTAFRFAMDSADVASGKSVFSVSKPDVIVQVTKHHFGADMFEITAVQPGYPAELLKEQITRMCDILGVPARGLVAGTASIGNDPRLSSTKATFGTNGVIDREKGVLRITPIIQAFAGAPAPNTIHGITILFNGEEATPNVLRSYSTPGVRLQAVADQNPSVIEYRIQLLSQDPKQLELPDSSAVEQKAPQTSSTVQHSGVDWMLWVALTTGAAAAGVLVYFLMLRASARPRR
jgi:hypothetical protein